VEPAPTTTTETDPSGRLGPDAVGSGVARPPATVREIAGIPVLSTPDIAAGVAAAARAEAGVRGATARDEAGREAGLEVVDGAVAEGAAADKDVLQRAASGPDVRGRGAASRDAASRDGVDRYVLDSAAAPVRVVVADDADGVRELVCLLLEMEPDFTVVGRARDGAEAIDVVLRTGPDLVLLDVAMPVLDGIAALPRVRRAVPTARVVVFTGFSAYTVRDQALALGADDVLEKGLGTGPLIERLRAVCRGRGTR
jgi:CheY-like chemotaxis protein